ncbi:MAG TPA: family 20 glycosylhydrolase [Rudaea sp.]|nr:family 20 glycosylhydrolase [Rudaea sp.]
MLTKPALIPMPVSVEPTPGYFELREGATLNVQATNAEAAGIARYFADLLARTRGIHLDVHPFGGADAHDAISFRIDPAFIVRGDSSDEGYELNVSGERIVVIARTPHGLFNGAITLWQLTTIDEGHSPARVRCMHIEDYPRFAWRGLMLDSARHFQPPTFVKKFIDDMAIHKLNVMHWHLTDDQGWRIEIKKYPKLTSIGAWRTPAHVVGSPAPYGGFYTQEEIRDIVRYAAQRYITIVPEIEMPGHAQAAIAAYPELGVTGKRPPVSPDWGVHTYLYNVDDSTFEFLQNVLTEVMDLFPGSYIHIGGDEAAKDQWHASAHVQQRMKELHIADEAALQSWFIARIGKFIDAHGRRLIGWDEILEGGLAPRATVMSWQGVKGGIDAAQKDHDVVMSPSPALYLDHVQSTLHDEPPGRPDVISVSDIYNYEPIPTELDEKHAHHILGAQANLWSEYMDTPQRVEHAAFPRAAALAEALWSPRATKNFTDFAARLPTQYARYRELNIAFADSAYAPEINVMPFGTTTGAQVKVSNQVALGNVRYTLDGSTPSATATRYRDMFNISVGTSLNVGVFDKTGLIASRARDVTRASYLRMNSDELQSCRPGAGLPLRLPGPSDGGGETTYRVDIFDPCWIYPAADMDTVRTVDVVAAERPYNYQLWHDADKVVLRKPQHPGGELEIHSDTCAGALLASVPLRGAADERGVAHLHASLMRIDGVHPLCFTFTRDAPSPLWMIDTVQLQN